jgi:hypothetical protein
MQTVADNGVEINASLLWQNVCVAGAKEILKDRHGLLADTLLKTVNDEENSAPVVVLDSHCKTQFATRTFEKLVEHGRGYAADDKRPFPGDLRPLDRNVDLLFNGRRWDKITSPSQDTASDVVELVLCMAATGHHLWMLAHAFYVNDVVGFGTKKVVALIALEAEVPGQLLDAVTADASGPMLKEMLAEVYHTIRWRQGHEAVNVVSQRAERACRNLAAKFSTSFEGEHFVPLVGCESAKAFEQCAAWEQLCGKIEAELKTAWEVSDDVYRETQNKGAKAIACAVADPSRLDCPLVYISEGFEDLTQYRRTWAVGRNCRFLQPNKKVTNMDYNSGDVKRMKQFCTAPGKDSGQIINLLLNEKADGTFFWNLLFMQYIKCVGVGAGSEQSYIFGVQTNIVVQKELLDSLILDAWECGEGKKNLQKLRELFAEHESDYDPKKKSLKRIADETISYWALEIGKDNKSFWEGGNYVPVVGRPAVLEFAGQWPLLVEEVTAGIRVLFEINDTVLGNMKSNSSSEVVCAVSDPSAIDCPLVYISKGFENMTGYSSEWTLGRNCRFLQPNTPDMNKKINGDELQRMREFCKKPQGTAKIVNLLLNERRDGTRFWNLLHMEHVVVKGKPYILGVQTILAMPMPSCFKDDETSRAVYEFDQALLSSFLDEMCRFLVKMRNHLRIGLTEGSMVKAAKYATESIMSFLKRHCDDFEGDHQVPRLGYTAVDQFRLDITWLTLLSKLKNRLVQVWGVSDFHEENVACAVSDPNAKDCPLVYISAKFETMTGYSRHWVLGRNCRFLQPNDHHRNMLFNEEDKLRMRDFCAGKMPEGSRIINLLVNESRSGQPFWNLLVMEHVWLEETCLIFGVQTALSSEVLRLAEVLCMDEDGLKELGRLRQILRTREASIDRLGLKTIADNMIREWAAGFPQNLELPRIQLKYSSMIIPFVGLVLHPEQCLETQVQDGLENGIRHFAFALNSLDRIEDKDYVSTMGHLLSLKIGELLYSLRKKYLHYLQAAISFTVIIRPQYIDCFTSISKAMGACGYKFAAWFLDVRAVHPEQPLSKKGVEKLQYCWDLMTNARESSEVEAIGLYGPIGSIIASMECFSKSTHGRASVMALDVYPHKEQDMVRLNIFQKLYASSYGKPTLFTYNLCGNNNAVVSHEAVQDAAGDYDIDAHTLLMKWAEAQGYGVLSSSIRDFPPKESSEAQPNYHRALTREYAEAPKARDCAAELERALTEVATTAAQQYHSEGGLLDRSTSGSVKRGSVSGSFKRSSLSGSVMKRSSLPPARSISSADTTQKRASAAATLASIHAVTKLRRASLAVTIGGESGHGTITAGLAQAAAAGRRASFRASDDDVTPRRVGTDTQLPPVRQNQRSNTTDSVKDDSTRVSTLPADLEKKFQSNNTVSTSASIMENQYAQMLGNSKRTNSKGGDSEMCPKPPSAPRGHAANPVHAQRFRNNAPQAFQREGSKEVESIFPETLVLGA